MGSPSLSALSPIPSPSQWSVTSGSSRASRRASAEEVAAHIIAEDDTIAAEGWRLL
jgi:hypothetical protein